MNRRGGKIKRILNSFIYERDGGRCFYCERGVSFRGWSWPPTKPEPSDATLDHIIPFSEGGSFTSENLVLSCKECNEQRGKLSADVFLKTKYNQETLPLTTPPPACYN